MDQGWIMYAILKNIHHAASIDHLEAYVTPLLKGSFLQRDGELKAIVIIQLNDKFGIAVERHALVRVCSDKVRRRLIKALNKQFYVDEDGQRLHVRADEYVVRLIMNDKRVNGSEFVWVKNDSRKGERRRLGLKIVHVPEKDFTGCGFGKLVRRW
ncbi:MAG: hypothetical protein PHH11_09675 [Methylomonas sp.]|nr:hypothetical protein [Methylomonas sp.]